MMTIDWKKAPPPEIWLQVGEDFNPEWDDAGWYEGGVTWSEHKIFDTDVRYVLAAPPPAAEQQNDDAADGAGG